MTEMLEQVMSVPAVAIIAWCDCNTDKCYGDFPISLVKTYHFQHGA